jgi:hypothetical protein
MDADEQPIGESRWPPAVVLLGFLVLNVTSASRPPGTA